MYSRNGYLPNSVSDHLKTMEYWIRERESIRLLRLNGKEPPWTEDPILIKYRFTNVVRKEDAVSQWLLDNWYNTNRDHRNSLLACTLARHFNLPSTLKILGFPNNWSPNDYLEKANIIKDSGERLFNSAYMVRGSVECSNKAEYVIMKVCDNVYRVRPKIHTDSVRESVDSLKKCYGLGSFMSGQIVADLTWFLGGCWKDKRSWAALGPGSKRGINRILMRPVNKSMRQEEFDNLLKELIEIQSKVLPKELTRRMEAIDYQNCLCEYDKYCRALFGEGRPKSKMKWSK